MLGSPIGHRLDQDETHKVAPLQSTVSVVSDDSGIGDMDDPDGMPMLVDEPKIVKSSTPTEQVTRSIPAEDMQDSLSMRKMMDTLNDENSSFIKKLGKLAKKMTLGVFKCVKHKKKMVDCGLKEVNIRDPHAPDSSMEDSARFGMHLKSVKENELFRHFIAYKEKDSLAESFTFCDDDELLMIEEEAVVGVHPLVALNCFWNLPVDRPVTFVTRRAIGKCDDHIVYKYFILTGTIHIFEDDVVDVVERMSVEAAVGIHDLLDVRFIGRDLRSFRSHDHAIVRITDGILDIDSQNNTPFHFDVLRYHAVQIQQGLFQPVIIWIIRHRDESSCYIISKDDENTDVQLLKDEKEAFTKINWRDFSEAGTKWITKSPPDGSQAHIFRCLSNPGLFLCSAREKLHCVEKESWEDAEGDAQTYFYVDPRT